MGGFAWVTLATNDSYSLGALVLAHSLKQAGTVHQLAVLVTPGVTTAMREKLASVFNIVQDVNILDSRDEANLRLLKRPELGITFTKLHCWRLTQYEKCVFLDADTLVLQNCDELFEREELSAAPDVGWPDCFNSGVFVYRPSLETYEKLISFALEKGSFDGGDQGLLNLFFSDWAYKDISKHLPFIYNMCSTACYSYLPAFKQFGANAKIVHFIGATKPWLQYFNIETRRVQPSGESSHLQEILQRWWDIFCSLIHPHLSPAMAGLAGAFAQLTLGVPRTAEQEAFESLLRKQSWEVGNIDYLGRDSFDNIWSKITETLNAGAPSAPVQVEATAPASEPSAPAQSQSQSTAPPQEEAKTIQPPVTPVDISSDTSTSIDTLTSEPAKPAEPVKSAEPIEPAKAAEPAQSAEATEPAKPSQPAQTIETAPVEPVKSTEPAVSAQPSKPQEPLPTPVEETSTPKVSQQQSSEEKVTEPISATSGEKDKEGSKEAAKVEKAAPDLQAEPLAAPVCPIPLKKEDPKPEKAPKPVEATAAIPEKSATAPTSKTVSTVSKQPSAHESPSVPELETPKSPTSAVPSPPATKPSAPTSSPKVSTKTTSKDTPKTSETPKAPTTPLKEISKPSPVKDISKTKTTEAAAPEASSSPSLEKGKPALTTEATVTESSSEGTSTPTPPPRKTDKPKKVAAKSKK